MIMAFYHRKKANLLKIILVLRYALIAELFISFVQGNNESLLIEIDFVLSVDMHQNVGKGNFSQLKDFESKSKVEIRNYVKSSQYLHNPISKRTYTGSFRPQETYPQNSYLLPQYMPSQNPPNAPSIDSVNQGAAETNKVQRVVNYMFNELNVNRDQCISRAELQGVEKYVKKTPHPFPTDQFVTVWTYKLDTNGDGCITIGEFKNIGDYLMNRLRPEYLQVQYF